jgi:hypothetical protein
MTLTWVIPLMLFLAACGDNGEGNNDTLLTGFTGVIIFGIVAYIIFRYVSKNKG